MGFYGEVGSGDPHGQATIHCECLTCDIIVLYQQDNGLGDLFGCAFAAQRNSLLQIYFLLIRAHRRMKGGADDSRRDAIDANVVAGKFSREGASELRQRAFHDLIRGIGDNASNARHGRKSK